MNKITWHGVLQAMLIVVQILNAIYTLPSVPAGAKVYIGSVVGILQFVLHQYALNQPTPNSPPVPPVQ